MKKYKLKCDRITSDMNFTPSINNILFYEYTNPLFRFTNNKISLLNIYLQISTVHQQMFSITVDANAKHISLMTRDVFNILTNNQFEHYKLRQFSFKINVMNDCAIDIDFNIVDDLSINKYNIKKKGIILTLFNNTYKNNLKLFYD